MSRGTRIQVSPLAQPGVMQMMRVGEEDVLLVHRDDADVAEQLVRPAVKNPPPE